MDLEQPFHVAVHQRQVFGIIYAMHEEAGHKMTQLTLHLCQKDYYNIPPAAVSHFCSLCDGCKSKVVKKQKHRGAAKPIISWEFRDRSVADLVD